MNRVFKFRVWNIQDNNWDNPAILEVWDKSGNFKPLYEPSDNYVIQQFTGLTDKNGKDIYEGDILQYYKKLKILEQPKYPDWIKYSWDNKDKITHKIEEDVGEVKFDKNNDYDDFYCDAMLGWIITSLQFNYNQSLYSILDKYNNQPLRKDYYWQEIEKHAIIIGNIFENKELLNPISKEFIIYT